MFIVEFSFLSVRLFSLQIKKFLKLMNKFNITSIEKFHSLYQDVKLCSGCRVSIPAAGVLLRANSRLGFCLQPSLLIRCDFHPSSPDAMFW